MNSVRCPHCATAFELSDALTLELRERLRLEFQDDIIQREAELLRQQEDSRKREEDLNKAKLELDAEVNRRTQSRV
jgi:hypothetical protein